MAAGAGGGAGVAATCAGGSLGTTTEELAGAGAGLTKLGESGTEGRGVEAGALVRVKFWAGTGADFEASTLEIRLSGWREYQKAPAARISVAAMPMMRPFFEPEAGVGVAVADSPSNCPPKTALCERWCVSGSVSGRAPPDDDAEAGKESVSGGSSGATSAAVDSDSRAKGASQDGILTSSTASEAGAKLRTAAAGLISGGAAGFTSDCAICRSLSATSGKGTNGFGVAAGIGAGGRAAGVSVKRREPNCS